MTLKGKAMRMSVQPSAAKYDAISIDETVIASTPNSRKIRPMWRDWCVLKWGRNRTPNRPARAAIRSIFRRTRDSSRTRVGFVKDSMVKVLITRRRSESQVRSPAGRPRGGPVSDAVDGPPQLAIELAEERVGVGRPRVEQGRPAHAVGGPDHDGRRPGKGTRVPPIRVAPRRPDLPAEGI